MNRILLVALPLAVLAAAGGGAVLYARFATPEPVVPEGSGVADSLPKPDSVAALRGPGIADSTRPGRAAPGSALTPPDSSPPAPTSPTAPPAKDSPLAVDSSAGAAPGPEPAAAAATGATGAPLESGSMAALPPERLSKIFGSMDPKQSGKVLEKMSDEDIMKVLASLRDRSAAAVLSNLPAERAARIAESVLHGGKAPRR